MRYYGVSPAYFISAFTDRFTPAQVAGALPDIRALGYDTFQMEIFHSDTLPAWETGGCEMVLNTAQQVGVRCTHFVAHFLLDAFAGPKAILDSRGIEECRRVVRMLDRVDACRVVTVPLPPLQLAPGSYTELWRGLVAKLARMNRTVADSGRRLAVEIMPGALACGSDGFLRLAGEIEGLGYNFDTGHAWAQGEPVWLIPDKLTDRIPGTHLCDNDGATNASLCPGDGTVPWQQTLRSLGASGYNGSLDVEIRCEPSRVHHEYARALENISRLQRADQEVPI